MDNVMRGQAAAAAQGRQSTRLGQISAYDPNTYSVKVQFPPDDVETGWIPLGSIGVGNGWGIYAGPSIGDQVQVSFQDGGADAGIAGLRLYDNTNVPLAVPSGEIWAQHKKGMYFKLTNDGKASFVDGQGGSVVLNGDGTVTSMGTWTHQGSMTVTGNATLQANLAVQGSTQVKAISSNGHNISNTHTHTGVQSGSGTTGSVT